MTTKFIPNIRHGGLYHVWVSTSDPRQPLTCIWMVPQFRSAELTKFEQSSAPCIKTRTIKRRAGEGSSGPSATKLISKRTTGSFTWKKGSGTFTPSAVRSLTDPAISLSS